MEKSSIRDIDAEHPRPLVLHIPTEICETIIDMLYSYRVEDSVASITTLHNCSLVCQDWRVRSQAMLFYRIRLSSTISLNRLSAVLDAARHLRDYVHEVELTGYHLHNTTSIVALFPVVFARKLPYLGRIDITHMLETDESWLPKGSDPPKAKSLPYIPLHPYFSTFLSSFTAVWVLVLHDTTFRSFSELRRVLHGFSKLEQLICDSVRWIVPGGLQTSVADITNQPFWPDGRGTLPPFAPRLQVLTVRVAIVIVCDMVDIFFLFSFWISPSTGRKNLY